MNKPAAVKLARFVKGLCPTQPFDEYTPDAWALVLADVSLADAQDAVRVVYSDLGNDQEYGGRRIEADDILRQVKRVREKRIKKHFDKVVPPPGLDQAEERAWIKAELRRIGDGLPPTKNTRGVLTRRAMPRALTGREW